MTNEILRKLDDATRQLVEEYQREPNSRISGLAKRLGLRVELHDLGYGEAGYLCSDAPGRSRSGYKIVVNSSDPVPRQRWTTAHEIGHYLLHVRGKDVFPTAPQQNRSTDILRHVYWGEEEREEREANAFAELVLIPVRLLERAVDRGEDNLGKLAAIFNVSEGAMEIALKRLRRSKWRTQIYTAAH